MSGAAGYVLRLESDRQEIFADTVDEEGFFAEPVPEFEHSRHQPLVCFIECGRGVVTHLGRGRRGQLAGTGLRRLNIEEVFSLKHPVRASKIAAAAPSRVRSKITQRLDSGGLLPPKSFEALVEILRQLAPETEQALAKYCSERTRRIRNLSEEVRTPLAHQKEAVATALAFAGMDRSELEGWDTPGDSPPRSYLDGLPQLRLREDQMLANDLVVLPGFEAIRHLPHPAVVFTNDRSRLTVLLANRLPLEEQLGVDLIYFNEEYRSFVMIQYKAMERESSTSMALYRLPDPQLETEIGRMEAVLEELASARAVGGIAGFRLCENPFFLKLCPRIVFEPDNTGLVAGMYLPLDYWKLLSADPVTIGPRGGRFVSYENNPRHFENTSFLYLVANGWVGTNIEQSALLNQVIRETLETGRAVVLAVNSRLHEALPYVEPNDANDLPQDFVAGLPEDFWNG